MSISPFESGSARRRKRAGRLAEIWRECIYSRRRLAELHRIGPAAVPLRWQQNRDGWTLVGSVLPPTE